MCKNKKTKNRQMFVSSVKMQKIISKNIIQLRVFFTFGFKLIQFTFKKSNNVTLESVTECQVIMPRRRCQLGLPWRNFMWKFLSFAITIMWLLGVPHFPRTAFLQQQEERVQLAIIAPQIDLNGYDTAFAQSWKKEESLLWDPTQSIPGTLLVKYFLFLFCCMS